MEIRGSWIAFKSYLESGSAQVGDGVSSVALPDNIAGLDVQTKTEPLQVVRSQDASVCSSINLHWDGAGIIDLDCSDDPLRVTADNIHCVLRCNGVEYYSNWFRVLTAVPTIISFFFVVYQQVNVLASVIWVLRDHFDLF